ncbi:hypothetical protein CDL12_10241 [Handroanthus impetiginosus]|uniref:Disease resistance N-terminal domain-containing protein n=1 Tax=Handroanthus impetiginosus TaxID=429701 RepID=A0A2G9HII6_9LAMI|nr:hypothetical protein CDL12_10241 [Handroanthus impetiginosus]
MSVFALLERLASPIGEQVNLVINSKQEAKTLYTKLEKIQVRLQDAEKQGLTDTGIKDWLKELEDVSYEMDDVLDEWQTMDIQLKVEGSQDFSDPWEKVVARVGGHWGRSTRLSSHNAMSRGIEYHSLLPFECLAPCLPSPGEISTVFQVYLLPVALPTLRVRGTWLG